MENSYFDSVQFENQIFTSQDLTQREYEDCVFVGCDLSSANLSGTRFSGTQFRECNLSNAILKKCAFQQTEFLNCKLIGLRFDDCNQLGFQAKFNGCQLNFSSFFQMKISGTVFEKCAMHGVDFIEADLKKSIFRDSDLLDAVFEYTQLEGADFRMAINYSFDPEINKIKGAKFDYPGVLGLLNKYQIQVE